MCFVTDEDVADPRVLRGGVQQDRPIGALLMWEIVLPLDEALPVAHYLLANGW
ncbi:MULTISPECIES: hypothetical protein [Burkholderia]|uniref:hypothetical protein n=1 Tax=Burkholderia TaxID=32008 RepID=UPI000A505D24|nr:MULTISPECIES: hypothetical protein [Burkholderia]